MNRLKQEYEQEIADLQRRLGALERKVANQQVEEKAETRPTSAGNYSAAAQQAAQELAKPRTLEEIEQAWRRRV